MKVLFIGDIHGLIEWEELAKEGMKNFYKIVFLGDYVDSFFVKRSIQLYNLNNICNFARKNKDQVTLLIGNHDYAYMHGIDGITGKQYEFAWEYKKIFDDNADLFQMAWGYTNDTTKKYTLATHAGYTTNYDEFFIKPEMKEGELIHDTLNRIHDRQELIWKVGRMRGGRGTPGPLWADYMEVLDDPYNGINQVFGHTPQVTPRLDFFGGDFIACIDDRGNKRVASMLINL